ncbi:MAG: aromatic-ring-hydroxylating dioxygenase subunit beta [Woeseia sp.]
MMLVRDPSLQADLTPSLRERLALLLHDESEQLDTGRFDAWLALFTPDCVYWMPLSPEQPDALDHVSLFYEDRLAMRLRIERLRHPRAHSLKDLIRTSRCGATPVAEKIDESTGDLVITRRFQMVEYHRDRTRLFAGIYTYQIADFRDDPRIRLKRVDLVDSAAPFEAIETFI